jgi:hypothetical protein
MSSHPISTRRNLNRKDLPKLFASSRGITRCLDVIWKMKFGALGKSTVSCGGEKYVDCYWCCSNSENYCRAAVRLVNAAIVLALLCEAKLTIRITVGLIAGLVWNPNLLSIRFDNLHARNVAWWESKYNVRAILYAGCSRIGTRSDVTSARRDTHTVVEYLVLNIPLLAPVSAGTDINLHVTRITCLIPDALITQEEVLANRCWSAYTS